MPGPRTQPTDLPAKQKPIEDLVVDAVMLALDSPASSAPRTGQVSQASAPSDATPIATTPEAAAGATTPEDVRIAETEVAGGIPLDDAQTIGAPQTPRPLGALDEALVRFKTALGRNPKTQEQLLRAALPSGFEVRNESGVLYYRAPDAKKFVPLDPEGFNNSVAEAFMDIVVDGGPEILETLATVGAEATGAGIGAATGGPVGAAAGFAAGSALGASAASGARDLAASALGAEITTEEATKEAAFSGTLAAATGGAFSAIRAVPAKVGRFSLDFVEEVLTQRPINRLTQYAKLQRGIEDIADSLNPAHLGKTRIGSATLNAADSILVNELGPKVGAVKEAVLRATGPGGAIPATRTDQLVTNKLDELGLSFSPTTNTFLRDMGRDELPEAFATGAGAKLLDNMIQIKSRIERAGGLPANDMFRIMDDMGKAFEGDASKDVRSLQKRLYRAMAQDRQKSVPTILKRAGFAEEAELAESAFRDYSVAKDVVDTLKAKIRGTGADKRQRENFAAITNAVVQKDNPAFLNRLKSIIGADSKEFAMIQAHEIEKALEAARDPVTGIIEARTFKRALRAKGDEVANTLYSPAQLARLDKFADDMSKINLSDIVKSEPARAQEFAMRGVALMQADLNARSAATRLIWQMFKNNKDMAEYLSREGMAKLAEKAPRTERNKILAIGNQLGKLYENSLIKKSLRGGQLLVSRSITDPMRPSQSVEDSAWEALLNEFDAINEDAD